MATGGSPAYPQGPSALDSPLAYPEDPFEGEWCDVFLWLQKDPDTNAKDLLYGFGHPTQRGSATPSCGPLHRRVKDWRGVMAKRLVYAESDEPASERSEKLQIVLVEVGNKGWNFGNILW